MRGTILCGVVETPEARAAAQLAAALAARLGLRLVLVHVASGPPGDAIHDLAVELGGDLEMRVVSGSRAEGLARAAVDEGADVIVVGSRAHGTRGRHLGSTLARELEA